MGNVKDWAYMLFRPKMERKLFNLLRLASSKQLCLDSVLVDVVPSHVMDENQIYKLSVDAFVFGVLDRTYDVSLTARKERYHDCSDVCREEPKCNVSVKEYVKNLAVIIKQNKVTTVTEIENLMCGSRLLQAVWNDLQQAGRIMYNALSDEYNLKGDDFYAYGYPLFSTQELYVFENKIVKLLNLPLGRPDGFAIKNISTVMAYHLSKAIA